MMEALTEFNKALERVNFKGTVKFGEPMSAHTSLRIGGAADVLAFPEDVLSLKNLLVAAKAQKLPVFMLGAGTNLLVRDGGIEGIVVFMEAFKRIEVIQDEGGKVRLFVEAGVPLPALINFTGNKGYSGIEALAGIPGSVGGAVYMNAGSFGAEIKDVIEAVTVMDMNGKITVLRKDKLKFSYRSSNISDDVVILSANIALKKDNPEAVTGRIREFLKKKKLTQPLGERSAGCVFKNPGGDSAGRLIDAAGCKGLKTGGVEVSMLHANYFINRDRASCGDFIKLMEIVKKKVREHTGNMLEPEIKIIGKED
ncbi:MAG: UDP-N-acetylmuramate dehydrogenase [Nitrospirae bacterium]|nr:UDP-N-acetylmuramate dehydrogenase [Nitrospirota bacterium]